MTTAPKKQSFVLDCSLCITWCFTDEATTYTNAVLDSLASAEAWVPALWTAEVCNVLHQAHKKERASKAQITKFLGLLCALPIAVEPTVPLTQMPHLVDLAGEYKLTAYDAVYLELAMRHGISIATLDKDLKTAARHAGVSLYLN